MLSKLSRVAFLIAAITTSICFATLPNPDPQTVALLKPKLNSDRITHFFGSYGVEPVKACGNIFPEGRISDLYSLDNQNHIMRTLAMVDFVSPIPDNLKPVYAAIQQGKSIGIALKDAGWEIVKQPIYFGEIKTTAAIQKRMHVKKDSASAVHIYQLKVKNAQHPTLMAFCTIVEIHSPEYLNTQWLKALNAEDYENFQQANGKTRQLLMKVGKCIDQI